MDTKHTRFDELFFNRSQESWSDISSHELLGFLTMKVSQAITWKEVEDKLKENRPLRIKLGIDPTGAELHLGHLVPIMLLKQFLRAGHHIDLIIGDFTAQVGDPSGRDSARSVITKDVIEKNLSTYIDQISKFIDVKKITVNRNSKWLADMKLPELFPLLQSVSLSEAMQRDDFRNRTKNGEGVTLAEATYALLMGIDSVNLKTDIELGGLDQLLNFQQCRVVMEAMGLTREAVVTTPILEGTAGDGRKMSKSFNNYIAVEAPVSDKFGKIMSVPDNLILSYFKSFADVHEREEKDLQVFINDEPLEAKKQLGAFLVALETGNLEDGKTERENFEKRFSKKEITADDAVALSAEDSATVFDTLMASDVFASKTELRRLFEQNAVRSIEGGGERIISIDETVENNQGLVKVGKMKVFTISMN